MTSIRSRVLALTAIAIGLTLVASGIVVYALARAALYDRFDEVLVAKAKELAAQVEEDDGRVESEIPAGDRDVFEVWAQDRVLVRSASLGARELAPDLTHQQIRATTLPDGRPGRQVTLRFHPRTEPDEPATQPPPTVVLVVARATAEVDKSVATIAKVLIGVGIGGTLLGLLLLVVIVRVALSPVRAVADAIAAVKEDTLTMTVATATPDELRPVVDRLDDLMRRLAKAFARERELTAEVAHELRTPLAGLRATIEVALDRERPADRYRRALEDCLSITKQTESVVHAMLALARLDAGVATLHRTRFDLDELVREALVPIATRAEERATRVSHSLPPVTVETDADMVRVVVQNLLDNAVTYCDEGGAIDVTLRAHELRVTNTGCTLDAEDLGHVFERFWRKDAARTSGHAGLGLPLCRRIMETLGGTIEVSVEDGTFVVTATLPS